MTSTLDRPDAATESTSSTPSKLVPRAPRSRLRRALLGVLVALVLVVSAVSIPVSMGLVPSIYQPPLPENAALAVGNQVVTVADYDKRVRTLKSLYGAQAPGDPAGQDRFRRDAAKSVAVSVVMDRAIADHHIVIPDPQVRQQLGGMVAAQFGNGPDAYKQFLAGLQQAGSSESEVIDEVRQQMGMTQLVTQVTNDVVVRDDELPAQFPRFAEQLGVPEQRRLSNIVVPTKEQAQDIVNQIRSGIPFVDIARQVSLDPATKDKGGDFGAPITKDKLQPGYREAAFAAPKGQIFGPVQSSSGWNVGMVADVTPGQPATYEESIIPLKEAVTNERKLARWRDWFNQQMVDAHVRYADTYRPADPSTLPEAVNATAPTPDQPAPGQAPPPGQPGR